MSPKSYDAYRGGRDALLRVIQSALDGDRQVAAAWLFGSFGRGEQDDLSDLDVWLVIPDGDIEGRVAQRRAEAARYGTPLLLLEAPQNAPEGGGYLMAYYEGAVGPYQVDWYWQPRSSAAAPSAVRMLKDVVGLTRDNRDVRFSAGAVDPEHANRTEHIVGFFWAMLHISAKYAARQPDASRLALLPQVLAPLSQISERCGEELDQASIQAWDQASLPAKLAVLRHLGDRMMAFQERLAQQSTETPLAMARNVARFLEYLDDRQGEGAAAVGPGLA